MGTTSRKGFVPAFCRTDPQDGCDDEKVGQEDNEERAQESKTSHCKHCHLFDLGVRAGQHYERRISTVEVIDRQGATEGQAKGQQCLRESMKEATGVRDCD